MWSLELPSNCRIGEIYSYRMDQELGISMTNGGRYLAASCGIDSHLLSKSATLQAGIMHYLRQTVLIKKIEDECFFANLNFEF